MPNLYANFVVDTDASDISVATVLIQYDLPVNFV